MDAPLTIHVLMAADENFLRAAAATLSSLGAAHDEAGSPAPTLHLVAADGPASRILEAGEWYRESYAAEVHTHNIDGDLLDGLSTREHLSTTTYLRLFADEFLPDDVDRYVYLDCDVLVRRALDELWSIDLGEAAVGGVRDQRILFASGPDGIARWRELGLDPASPFFNAGILLIDRQRWSQRRIGPDAADYARRYADSLHWADQDALNVVLAGKICEVDPRWNSLVCLLDEPGFADAVLGTEVVDRLRNDPWIVHYAGGQKPWQAGSSVPFVEEWVEAIRRTPWASVEAEAPRHRSNRFKLHGVKRRARLAARALVKGY